MAKKARASKKKEAFWDWFRRNNKNKTFTADEVKILLEEIKQFNCGAIDAYLSKHVDQVCEKWLKLKGK